MVITNNNINCDYLSTNPQAGSPKGIFINQCDPVNHLQIELNEIEINPKGAFSFGILQTGFTNPPPPALNSQISDNHITINNGPTSMFRFGYEGVSIQSYEFGPNNIIDIYDTKPGSYGVLLNNCDLINLHEDTINGPGFNVGSTASIIPKGIYVANTTNSIYECNVMNDLVNGMTFEGLCPGTTDNIKGNLINNYWLGLYYNSNSNTGSQAWTGNKWTGTNGYYGAVDDNIMYMMSRYWVSYPSNPYLPTTPAFNQYWFTQAFHPTFECSVQEILGEDSPIVQLIILDP